MAGLNFVGNAVYSDVAEEKENVAQFEFIPYILSQCANIYEVKEKLSNINITNTRFSEKFPCAELHWIIADRNGAITVEAMSDGLHIYDNEVGVLTNNPPIHQRTRLSYPTIFPVPVKPLFQTSLILYPAR